MYLAELHVENFRIFGSDSDALCLVLDPGLNVLVGENDSGKSAIIDAVRLLLSTRASDGFRLTEEDFHVDGSGRAVTLMVRGVFRGLSEGEHGRFLEWLTTDEVDPRLIITLQASRREKQSGRGRRVVATTRAGKRSDGPALEGDVRDFLQATYLRPLRDAEGELSGGRGSRLSQILEAHPSFKEHAKDDGTPESPPTTLVGIIRRAEQEVRKSTLVRGTAEKLTGLYLRPMSIGHVPLTGEIGIARDTELRSVLEKLELWLAPSVEGATRTRRGLGLNNVLFMAAELLLLSGEPDTTLPLLLIEEPEAHLHPQLQARLIEFLEAQTERPSNKEETQTPPRHDGNSASPKASDPVQILLTTHSPHFASSINLDHLFIVSAGRCFPLKRGATLLDEGDYQFLRRFLDVTKANLFFARGVLIVEGDAENLLLPVLAKKLGRPLGQHGVSIVNVGSTALLRYAKIFQRRSGSPPDVRVARIADLDTPSQSADYVKKARAEAVDGSVKPASGDDEESDETVAKPEELARLRGVRRQALSADDASPVRTFASTLWTLEHDLALDGLAKEVHRAVFIGRRSQSRRKRGQSALTADDRTRLATNADEEFAKLLEACAGDQGVLAARIYEPLHKRQASKAEVAELLAQILEEDKRNSAELRSIVSPYLVDAIEYVTRHDAAQAEVTVVVP